jgi:hypothetical protein
VRATWRYDRAVSWTFVVRSTELPAFRQCRRAWDLGARVRQNYLPRVPAPVDFEQAVRDALAVYYFPAMDDWDRSIVRPLALKAVDRSMRESRAAYEQHQPLTDGEVEAHEHHRSLGQRLMMNYFAWAAEIDDFDSIFADYQVWAPIADPAQPDCDLGTLDERPVRYLGRIDQLIGDPDDEFWVVHNRFVRDRWTDDDTLIDDEIARGHCWALQTAYPQLLVAGTIANELRVDGQMEVEPPAAFVERDRREMNGGRHVNYHRSPHTPQERLSSPDPAGDRVSDDNIADQLDNGLFRRTVVRRSQASIAAAGLRVARDVVEMRRDDLPVPPTFSDAHCPGCTFKAPCDAMEAGHDWQYVLDLRYRQRRDDADDDLERRSPFRPGSRADARRDESRIVNVRWG